MKQLWIQTVPFQRIAWGSSLAIVITSRRVGGSGVKRLVLSVRPCVRPSVCPSVRCLSTQKSSYFAICRVKQLLNTTVTLKSKKKMAGCVPDSRQSSSIRCISSSFLFHNGTFCHFLIRSQLEYDGGRAYTDSRHVLILAVLSGFGYTASYTVPTAPSTKSAVLPGPSCKLSSAGYVSVRDFQLSVKFSTELSICHYYSNS